LQDRIDFNCGNHNHSYYKQLNDILKFVVFQVDMKFNNSS